MNKHLSGAN